MTKPGKPRIAVCGVGYWGKNLAKHFHELGVLAGFCDKRPEALRVFQNLYPDAKFSSNCETLFQDSDIDAVAIALPTPEHYSFAKAALNAGKHVFVEKPIALKVKHAEDLCRIAALRKRKLMVGHLLLYHPAVRELKQIIHKKILGDTYYLYSQRLNLGQIRRDENALWSLAPHDISVILELFGKRIRWVSARGYTYIQKKQGIEDVIFMHFEFEDGKSAHIHLSWLDPHKVRRLTLVGSRKMVVFDDMETVDKVKLYDKGVDLPDGTPKDSAYIRSIPVRTGEVRTIPVDNIEPLKAECAHFADCVHYGREPYSNGWSGLAVLRLLDLATRSLKSAGKKIRVPVL